MCHLNCQLLLSLEIFLNEFLQVGIISCYSEVSAVGTYTPTHLIEWQVHAFRPTILGGALVWGANVLYMYRPLEEGLQNKAVGMDFSVHTKYQF